MQSKLGGEEMTWRNAALALGETLSPNGPDRYYEYSPDTWLGWAKLMTKSPCYRCPRCGTGMQPDPGAKAAKPLTQAKSLRDEIAIAVLNGMESTPDDSTYNTPNVLTLQEWRDGKLTEKARYCYTMADFMLKARTYEQI